LKLSVFSTGTSQDGVSLKDLFGGRSGQEMVKDEVSFEPPLDKLASLLTAAKQMLDRHTEKPASPDDSASP
jgi:hypothetical protein